MPSSKPDILSALSWLVDSGADEAVHESPVNHFALPGNGGDRARLPGGSNNRDQRPGGPLPIRLGYPRPTGSIGRQPPPKPASESGDSIATAMETAAACSSLAELRAALEAFDGCALR